MTHTTIVNTIKKIKTPRMLRRKKLDKPLYSILCPCGQSYLIDRIWMNNFCHEENEFGKKIPTSYMKQETAMKNELDELFWDNSHIWKV